MDVLDDVGTETVSPRIVVAFLLGLAVGAAVVFGLPFGKAVAPAPDERAPEPPPGTAPTDPEGSGTAVEDGPTGGTRAAARDGKTSPPGSADRPSSYHLARALVAGMEGRDEECRKELLAAIDAGSGFGDVKGVIEELGPTRVVDLLAVLVKARPEVAWDYLWVARALDRGDRTDLARRLLAAALERRGVTFVTDSDEALAWLLTRWPRETAALLARLSRGQDWEAEPSRKVARLLVQEDLPDVAREFLFRVLAKSPTDAWALGLLGEIDPTGALPLALAAVDVQPGNPELRGRLGRIRLTLDDAEGAFRAFLRAVDLEDGAGDRRKWLRGLITADPERAVPVLQAQAREGDDEMVGLYARGLVAADREREAFEVFLEAHRRDPGDSEWLHRLQVLDAKRFTDWVEGRGDLSGLGNELRGNYANALLAQGRREEAWDQYLVAHQQDDDWEWMRGLARARPEEAARILEAARAADPDEPAVLSALAQAYAGMGRREEAVELLLRAIEESDHGPRWHSALAVIEPARGMTMLRSALEEKPRNDELWGALGDAYRELGQLDEARRAYDRALELDPGDWEWSLRRDQVR